MELCFSVEKISPRAGIELEFARSVGKIMKRINSMELN